MHARYYLILLSLFFFSCAGESEQLPNDPEQVTTQWIEWLDNNQFGKLKKISLGGTLAYINDMEAFHKGLTEDEMENETTVVERINCKDSDNGEKSCTYCCKDGEEETFILIEDNGQWKVKDIIIDISDLDEETLQQEKVMEDMLNKKLENQ